MKKDIIKFGYSDLIPKKKKLFEEVISNGIGPSEPRWLYKLLQWIMPKWLTHASGHQHDFYYRRGGNEIDRHEADIKFYLMILQDAREGTPNYFLYLLRRIRAWLYYKAVSIFGYKYFSYGPYKTIDEILERDV